MGKIPYEISLWQEEHINKKWKLESIEDVEEGDRLYYKKDTSIADTDTRFPRPNPDVEGIYILYGPRNPLVSDGRSISIGKITLDDTGSVGDYGYVRLEDLQGIRDILEERKVSVLGSDEATFFGKAYEIHFIENVNGTHELTFSLPKYYQKEGQKYKNENVDLIINESKIKLNYRNEWFDFIVKDISENRSAEGIYYSYQCIDSYVNELSKQGYKITFDDLNNIGNINQLSEIVLEGSDWKYIPIDENNEDFFEKETTIYDENGEYHIDPSTGLPVEYITNKKNNVIVYNQELNKYLYKYKGYQQGSAFVNIELWGYEETNPTTPSYTLDLISNGSNFSGSSSGKNDPPGWAPTIYDVEDGRLASTCELSIKNSQYYNDHGERYKPILLQARNSNHDYPSLSGRFREIGVSNTTIPPLTDGLIENASYCLKLSIVGNEYGPISDMRLNFNIIDEISNKRLFGTNQEIYRSNWCYDENGAAIPTLRGDNDIADIYVYFINNNSFSYPYLTFEWSSSTENRTIVPLKIKEVSLFKVELKHLTLENEEYLNNLYTQAEADTNKMLLISKDLQDPFGDGIDQDEFLSNVLIPDEVQEETNLKTYYFMYRKNEDGTYEEYNLPENATPVLAEEEGLKTRTINASESNRFNLLQTIAETFEVWPKFIIKHYPNGQVKRDSNYNLEKYITFDSSQGSYNDFGFHYKVNLDSIERVLNTDELVTKMYVADLENSVYEDGALSIKDASGNIGKDTFLINFDYYMKQGVLDAINVMSDLYGTTSNDLGYLPNLGIINTKLYDLSLKMSALQSEIINLQTLIEQGYDSQIEVLKNLIQEKDLDKVMVQSSSLSGIYTSEQIEDLEILVNQYKERIDQLEEEKTKKQTILTSKEAELGYITRAFNTKTNQKNYLNNIFNKKYERFIQEGTWQDSNYTDVEAYYLDAQKVLITSANPQVSYTINVIDIMGIEGFEEAEFRAGDTTFVVDPEMFGYDSKGTPRREEAIISEIDTDLENISNTTITVQNYTTQFEDLFERISAATETLQYNESNWDKVSNFNSDGTINSDIFQDTLLNNNFILMQEFNNSIKADNTGISLSDLTNAAKQVRITSGGIFISKTGGKTWQTGITADGINASLLTAGEVDTQKVVITNGRYPTFNWNPLGLSAYKVGKQTLNGEEVITADVTTFVRFDQHGLYFMKGFSDFGYVTDSVSGERYPWYEGEESWEDRLAKIENNSNVSLTWNGLLIKSDDGSVNISTQQNTIYVQDTFGNKRVELGNLGDSQYGLIFRNINNEEVLKTNDTGELWLKRELYIGGESTDSSIIQLSGLDDPSVPAISITSNNKGIIPFQVVNDEGDTTFQIDSDGNLTISGDLNAFTGTFSGELVGATGTFSGNLSAAGGTFTGELVAASGSFSGEIVAKMGYIETLLGIGNTSSDQFYYNSGISTVSEYDGKTNIPALWINNGVFSVDHSGNAKVQGDITVQSGYIAKTLGIGSQVNDSYQSGISADIVNQTYALWINNDVFTVDHNGNLIAKSANISGTINASNGNILGMLKVGEDGLCTIDGTAATTEVIKRFWVKDEQNEDQFYVDSTGKLFAKNADITGSINSSSGHITGKIYVGDVNFEGDIPTGSFTVIDGSIESELPADQIPVKRILIQNNNEDSFSVDSLGNIVSNGSFAINGDATIGGNLDLGWIHFSATANNNSGEIYASGEEGSGFKRWSITGDGDAYFRNITASGEIHSTRFVTNEVQTSSGTILVRPSSRLKDIRIESNGYTLVLEETNFTIDPEDIIYIIPNSFSYINQGVTINYKLYGKVNSYTNTDSGTEVFIEKIYNYQNEVTIIESGTTSDVIILKSILIDSIIINYGQIGDVGIAINSDNSGDGIYNQKAITIFKNLGIDSTSNNFKTDPTVVLGSLDNITMNGSSLTDIIGSTAADNYGLFSNNAYLKGAIMTENGGLVTPEGYNGYDYDANNPTKKILLWAGGQLRNGKLNLSQTKFYVTDEGELFASEGTFRGKIITTDAEISGSIIGEGLAIDGKSKGIYIKNGNVVPASISSLINPNGIHLFSDGDLKIYNKRFTEEDFSTLDISDINTFESDTIYPYIFSDDRSDYEGLYSTNFKCFNFSIENSIQKGIILNNSGMNFVEYSTMRPSGSELNNFNYQKSQLNNSNNTIFSISLEKDSSDNYLKFNSNSTGVSIYGNKVDAEIMTNDYTYIRQKLQIQDNVIITPKFRDGIQTGFDIFIE